MKQQSELWTNGSELWHNDINIDNEKKIWNINITVRIRYNVIEELWSLWSAIIGIAQGPKQTWQWRESNPQPSDHESPRPGCRLISEVVGFLYDNCPQYSPVQWYKYQPRFGKPSKHLPLERDWFNEEVKKNSTS
jgi:hypothetical protein